MEKDTSLLSGTSFNRTKLANDFARFNVVYIFGRWTLNQEKKENDGVELEESIPHFDSATVPLDICREILILLPAKSLIRLRAVCKDWCSVIDDPLFVKAHTDKQLSSKTIIIRNSSDHPLYSFDLDDLNFANGLQKITASPLDYTPSGLSLLKAFPVSMCNGLILVRGKSWEIWNPLTHERLKLPRIKCNPNPEKEGIGLGYDYTSDDYKVVVIHRHRLHRRSHGRENIACHTHVYSLKSDSWRNVGSCPFYDFSVWFRGPHGPGVYLHGALHWTVFREPYRMNMIIAFDLGSEKYRQMPLPPLEERAYVVTQKRYLSVLDGCLVLNDYSHSDSRDDERELYAVWVMKDYGVEDSWIKLFSLEDGECFYCRVEFGCDLRPVAYMKDKTQILLQRTEYRGFLIFDLKSNCVKRVEIHGLTDTLHLQFIPRTIFRLHDNCGVNGSVTTNRRRRRRMKRTSNMKMSDTN
ncbi:hypothetical protein CASFOL_031421 [Castilleja foliolosa]|uniref:F-box domain-containing protein n=1 Tax=Castilleja foliolosa TaxID=1961234 RepID=A0ABD3C5J3_9LAMI